MVEPTHPEAVAPERNRWISSNGVRLHVHEWGDPQAVPILLCHGMFDHSRGFDLIAPLLAQRFRVLALDARGHGDSGWADSYLWPMDVLDIVNVLRDLGRPAHVLGHSKGGGQVMDAALVAPEAVIKLVNLDGFGPPDDGFEPPSGPDTRALGVAEQCGRFLDRRRTASQRKDWKAYASFDALVERRGEQNPRLAEIEEWLRYFVYLAARESEDGWRWKADPHFSSGGFGPFKADWIGPEWKHLRSPLLAVIGGIPDTWGPIPEETLAERLSNVPELERATVEDAGHFIHMEQPVETARLILDFLDS
jgi:pimeloyl-ACP methyl ester carboxylesterase